MRDRGQGGVHRLVQPGKVRFGDIEIRLGVGGDEEGQEEGHDEKEDQEDDEEEADADQRGEQHRLQADLLGLVRHRLSPLASRLSRRARRLQWER